jgi:hypothetical protein
VAGVGAVPSRLPDVALRLGAKTARVPGAAEEVGAGEDARLVETVAAVQQGLRALARDADTKKAPSLKLCGGYSEFRFSTLQRASTLASC